MVGPPVSRQRPRTGRPTTKSVRLPGRRGLSASHSVGGLQGNADADDLFNTIWEERGHGCYLRDRHFW